VSDYNKYQENSNQNEGNIEKWTGSFSKADGGCTIIINSIINSIKDGFTLGLYSYLLCRPVNWKLNAQHLAEHFCCDKARIYKSLTLLQEIGLIVRETMRDKGKFVEFNYTIHLYPPSDSLLSKLPPIQKNSQLNKGDSPFLKKPELVKPELINSDTYKTKILQTKELTTTTDPNTARENFDKSSSYLLKLRDRYLSRDKRTNEEFLRQCHFHLGESDKHAWAQPQALQGLENIIKKGSFETPRGYKSNQPTETDPDVVKNSEKAYKKRIAEYEALKGLNLAPLLA
jgi:hypothetical protein